MRTIKFRLWDAENKLMIGGDELAFEEYAPLCDLLTRKEIMQYTGLKDMNDKEIYEGDVLRLSDKEYEVNFRRNVQVKWSSGGWWYVEVRNDDGMSIDTLFVGYCHDDSVVIGNIYENPELCCMGCEECIPEEDHP